MRFVERKAEVDTFIIIARASSLTNIAVLAKEILIFRSASKCTVLEKQDWKLLQINVLFHNLNRIQRYENQQV
jgi:hypothetical protein